MQPSPWAVICSQYWGTLPHLQIIWWKSNSMGDLTNIGGHDPLSPRDRRPCPRHPSSVNTFQPYPPHLMYCWLCRKILRNVLVCELLWVSAKKAVYTHSLSCLWNFSLWGDHTPTVQWALQLANVMFVRVTPLRQRKSLNFVILTVLEFMLSMTGSCRPSQWLFISTLYHNFTNLHIQLAYKRKVWFQHNWIW